MLDLYLDFDGVLVDSNDVKEKAFLDIAFSAGGDLGVTYMKTLRGDNPGFSRHVVFQLFSEHFGLSLKSQRNLVDEFSNLTYSKILAAVRSSAMGPLSSRSDLSPSVISAADREDLLRIVSAFGWSEIFKDRIWGSPATKKEIFSNILPASLNSDHSQLFVGDSKSDFEVSKEFGIPFAFVSDWSRWIPTSEEAGNFQYFVGNLNELLEVI